MARSRGQELYNEFSRVLREVVAGIEKLIREGYEYTWIDVYNLLEELLNTYRLELEEENIHNGDKWYLKATAKIESIREGVGYKYFDNIRSEYQGNSQDISEDEPESEGGQLFGYTVITAQQCEQGLNDTGKPGSVRGQVILSLEELEEYLNDIPSEYVGGVIITDDGFQVCVEKYTKRVRK